MATKKDKKIVVKRKPTSKDWDKIIAAYLAGKVDPKDIPSEFPNIDVTEKAVRKKLSLVGAIQQKKSMDDAVVDAMFKVTKEQRIKSALDCVKLYESGAKIIETLLVKYKDELDTGVTKGKSRATAYNVDMLMSGVTKIQKGYRVAYGEDDKGNLFEEEPKVLTIEGISEDKI